MPEPRPAPGPVPPARRLVGIVVGMVALLVLAGCDGFSLQFGGLDTSSLEADILDGLRADLPVDLERVECPSGVEPREGDVFVCRVFATDGSIGTVEVQQVDDGGNVEWELTEVLAPDGG